MGPGSSGAMVLFAVVGQDSRIHDHGASGKGRAALCPIDGAVVNAGFGSHANVVVADLQFGPVQASGKLHQARVGLVGHGHAEGAVVRRIKRVEPRPLLPTGRGAQYQQPGSQSFKDQTGDGSIGPKLVQQDRVFGEQAHLVGITTASHRRRRTGVFGCLFGARGGRNSCLVGRNEHVLIDFSGAGSQQDFATRSLGALFPVPGNGRYVRSDRQALLDWQGEFVALVLGAPAATTVCDLLLRGRRDTVQFILRGPGPIHIAPKSVEFLKFLEGRMVVIGLSVACRDKGVGSRWIDKDVRDPTVSTRYGRRERHPLVQDPTAHSANVPPGDEAQRAAARVTGIHPRRRRRCKPSSRAFQGRHHPGIRGGNASVSGRPERTERGSRSARSRENGIVFVSLVCGAVPGIGWVQHAAHKS
mmetsp:Transcript_2603/g.6096  ORF Transcript_2603/g.6096 Transcript_2603/m.6096 type:complete len:416 (-) Transcript_2603:524-1771(-)